MLKMKKIETHQLKTLFRAIIPKLQNRKTISNKNQDKKRIKLHQAYEHFANILERNLNQRNIVEKTEDDEDKLFCLSLFKEIKKSTWAYTLTN